MTLDDMTLAALSGGDNLVAVRNGAGEVVGFFAPVRQEYAEEYARTAAKAYSVRGERPRKPMTTPEVAAYLESLEGAT